MDVLTKTPKTPERGFGEPLRERVIWEAEGGELKTASTTHRQLDAAAPD